MIGHCKLPGANAVSHAGTPRAKSLERWRISPCARASSSHHIDAGLARLAIRSAKQPPTTRCLGIHSLRVAPGAGARPRQLCWTRQLPPAGREPHSVGLIEGGSYCSGRPNRFFQGLHAKRQPAAIAEDLGDQRCKLRDRDLLAAPTFTCCSPE
jgi:hypothetical protein